MYKFYAVMALCLASIAGFAIFGCVERGEPGPEGSSSTLHSDSADNLDVHITAKDVDRPANYAAAVNRIIQYRDSIREAIASGAPGQAHRPLDEASFVLDWLPELARDSGIPKSHWETVNVSAQQIRSLFDELHARIDNHQAPDFESVADRVQQAIDTLARVEASSSPGLPPEGTNLQQEGQSP